MRALKLNANIPTHHLGLCQLRQLMEHHSILTTVHPLNIFLHKEPAPLLGDHSYLNCTEERDQDVQYAKCSFTDFEDGCLRGGITPLSVTSGHLRLRTVGHAKGKN